MFQGHLQVKVMLTRGGRRETVSRVWEMESEGLGVAGVRGTEKEGKPPEMTKSLREGWRNSWRSPTCVITRFLPSVVNLWDVGDGRADWGPELPALLHQAQRPPGPCVAGDLRADP